MTGIHIFAPGTKLFQDAEGTIPAEKDGDMIARIESPDGWCAIQTVVSRRPTFRADFRQPAIEVAYQEWIDSETTGGGA